MSAAERYYLVWDAYLGVAHPISTSEARKGHIELAHVGPRLSAHEIGYDIEDGEVLVALKPSELERLINDIHEVRP